MSVVNRIRDQMILWLGIKFVLIVQGDPIFFLLSNICFTSINDSILKTIKEIKIFSLFDHVKLLQVSLHSRYLCIHILVI